MSITAMQVVVDHILKNTRGNEQPERVYLPKWLWQQFELEIKDHYRRRQQAKPDLASSYPFCSADASEEGFLNYIFHGVPVCLEAE